MVDDEGCLLPMMDQAIIIIFSSPHSRNLLLLLLASTLDAIAIGVTDKNNIVKMVTRTGSLNAFMARSDSPSRKDKDGTQSVFSRRSRKSTSRKDDGERSVATTASGSKRRSGSLTALLARKDKDKDKDGTKGRSSTASVMSRRSTRTTRTDKDERSTTSTIKTRRSRSSRTSYRRTSSNKAKRSSSNSVTPRRRCKSPSWRESLKRSISGRSSLNGRGNSGPLEAMKAAVTSAMDKKHVDDAAFERAVKQCIPSCFTLLASQDEETRAQEDYYALDKYRLPKLPSLMGKAVSVATCALLELMCENPEKFVAGAGSSKSDSDATKMMTCQQLLQHLPERIQEASKLSVKPMITSSRPLGPPRLAQSQYAPFTIVPSTHTKGTKRALLIGVLSGGTYSGLDNNKPLHAPPNDIGLMHYFLTKYAGFKSKNISVLLEEDDQTLNDTAHTECTEYKKSKPTRRNILAGFEKLARLSMPNDTCFIQFSGHGGRGYHNLYMIPSDYDKNGPIRDQDIMQKLIKAMPAGVHTTMLFDCCYSGTLADLPYILKSPASNTNGRQEIEYYFDTTKGGEEDGTGSDGGDDESSTSVTMPDDSFESLSNSKTQRHTAAKRTTTTNNTSATEVHSKERVNSTTKGSSSQRKAHRTSKNGTNQKDDRFNNSMPNLSSSKSNNKSTSCCDSPKKPKRSASLRKRFNSSLPDIAADSSKKSASSSKAPSMPKRTASVSRSIQQKSLSSGGKKNPTKNDDKDVSSVDANKTPSLRRIQRNVSSSNGSLAAKLGRLTKKSDASSCAESKSLADISVSSKGSRRTSFLKSTSSQKATSPSLRKGSKRQSSNSVADEKNSPATTTATTTRRRGSHASGRKKQVEDASATTLSWTRISSAKKDEDAAKVAEETARRKAVERSKSEAASLRSIRAAATAQKRESSVPATTRRSSRNAVAAAAAAASK